MTEKVIKLTKPQLIMLQEALHSYDSDLHDDIEQGGDKKQLKTLDALRRKLHD